MRVCVMSLLVLNTQRIITRQSSAMFLVTVLVSFSLFLFVLVFRPANLLFWFTVTALIGSSQLCSADELMVHYLFSTTERKH